MERRTFLIGGLSGLSLLALSACTSDTPTPTTPLPTPSVTPSASLGPEPSAFLRSSWATDPFSLGGTSYIPVGVAPSQRSVLGNPVLDRLFFAGEATSANNAGTVAGAWESGVRAAIEVADVAAPGERIAIVGAGMAGAAAARQLNAAGYDVVVLEARERIGGRIDTVTGGDWAFPVERGALVIGDLPASPFVGELLALEIDSRLLSEPEEVRAEDGTVVTPPADLGAAVLSAVDAAIDADDDLSLAEAIAAVPETVDPSASPESGSGDSDPGESQVAASAWTPFYLDTVVAQLTGADADEISARYGWSSDDDSTGRIVVGGLQTLVENSLGDLDVRLSSTIAGVTVADDSIALRLANGESFSADRVVVTVPLGVLQGGDMTFDPELPSAHREAISTLGVGARESVVLRFDEKVWTTDATEWAVVDSDALVSKWFNLEPFTGEAVLIGAIAASNAAEMADLSDDDVRARALESLAPFLSA